MNQHQPPVTNDQQLTLMTFIAAVSVCAAAYLWHCNDQLTQQNQQLTTQLRDTQIKLEQTERTLLMTH